MSVCGASLCQSAALISSGGGWWGVRKVTPSFAYRISWLVCLPALKYVTVTSNLDPSASQSGSWAESDEQRRLDISVKLQQRSLKQKK